MVKILDLIKASFLSSYLKVLIVIAGSYCEAFIKEIIKSCLNSFTEIAQD